jgi:tripartite-type tricarboxylate transporter receptor subunit TctC
MIRFLFAAVLVSVLGVGSPVHAQSYPNRTIKLVVPFPAGSSRSGCKPVSANR